MGTENTPDRDVKRNIFQRLLGRCATKTPADPDCWRFENNEVIVDLSRAPELENRGGGLRLESDTLPKRVLIVRGHDDEFYALHNCCAHAGRRLDPVPGDSTVQCCSMGRSTYDYSGKVLRGGAESGIDTFPIRQGDGRLYVKLD